MSDNIDKWDSRLEYIHYENSKDIDVPDEIYRKLKYYNPLIIDWFAGLAANNPQSTAKLYIDNIKAYKDNILRVNIGKI